MGRENKEVVDDANVLLHNF